MREEGDPASADSGAALPLLNPGLPKLGAASATMCWPCAGGVDTGPALPRPQCLLVEKRARGVQTPLVTYTGTKEHRRSRISCIIWLPGL